MISQLLIYYLLVFSSLYLFIYMLLMMMPWPHGILTTISGKQYVHRRPAFPLCSFQYLPMSSSTTVPRRLNSIYFSLDSGSDCLWGRQLSWPCQRGCYIGQDKYLKLSLLSEDIASSSWHQQWWLLCSMPSLRGSHEGVGLASETSSFLLASAGVSPCWSPEHVKPLTCVNGQSLIGETCDHLQTWCPLWGK